MRISGTSIYRFSIPLKRTIRVSSRDIGSRDGYIIVIRDESGNIGFGEVAPLPGLDDITPEYCLGELKNFAESSQGEPINLMNWNPRAPFMGLLDLPGSYSDLSLFGIESALLFLFLKQPDFPAKNYFGDLSMGISLPVNGLFFPHESEKNAEEQYDALVKSGYETVKVKVGRIPEETEINQIRNLAGRMGKQIKLRLDGNRSLEPDALDRYSRALKGLEIEYFEEPLEDASLYGKIKHRIALDESAADYLKPEGVDTRKFPGNITAFIIKTSRFKGLNGIFRAIDAANSAGIKTVLSSTFNTGAGISALALAEPRLDAELKTSHGFDTYRYLESDLLKERLSLGNGMITIPGPVLFFNDILDMNMLTGVKF